MSPTLSFSLIFMFIFYFMLRYILKRFKGYKLPILFERYHDDPFKTFLQPLILIVGFFIGFTIFNLFSYIL